MELGSHWIAEIEPLATEMLVEQQRVQSFLEQLPNALGLQVLGHPVVQQSDDGAVRGVVLLSESHASAHTDPGHGLVYVDLFSCAPFDVGQARAIFLQFWPGVIKVERMIHRGET